MAKLLVFVVLVAVASAADLRYNPYIRILRQQQETNPDGSYNWFYDTENGISAQEQGQVRQLPQQEALEATGSFSYTSPEGVPVAITYIANENGFQPQGSVIPTPPPTPPAILKALEWIRTHPEPAGNTYRFKK